MCTVFYVHNKWSANSFMNERGVLRGENKMAAAPCLATVTAWKYWDEGEWTPGDIAATCSDTGRY